MQLVHGEAQLIEVDVDIDEQVGGQRWGKHPLGTGTGQAGGMRARQAQLPQDCLGDPMSQPMDGGFQTPPRYPGELPAPGLGTKTRGIWGMQDGGPENYTDLDLQLTKVWGFQDPITPLCPSQGQAGLLGGDSLSRSRGWPKALTVRPLAAISGRVRVAGVVSRLRALVSCSITASISCREVAGHSCCGGSPHPLTSGKDQVMVPPSSCLCGPTLTA